MKYNVSWVYEVRADPQYKCEYYISEPFDSLLEPCVIRLIFFVLIAFCNEALYVIYPIFVGSRGAARRPLPTPPLPTFVKT